jgi:hypothetical protein
MANNNTINSNVTPRSSTTMESVTSSSYQQTVLGGAGDLLDDGEATSSSQTQTNMRLSQQLRQRRKNGGSGGLAGTAGSAVCGCCAAGYDSSEVLEYNYNIPPPSQPHETAQPLPRIRERGEFYIDSYNDQPMSCSFGTNEHVRDCVV